MNLLAEINQAMEYIESHLTENIDFEKIARIAGCSQYHFRRMFSYLSGIPLGEYIRCRKLSMAAELLQSGQKVIDCAALFGYGSPDAFRKAFQMFHGITPSEAKRSDAPFMAFPPMFFHLTKHGGNKMEYRIVQKEAFKIVGFKKRIIMQFEGKNPQMDALWKKLTPELIREMKDLCDTEPKGMLSVSADFSERTKEGTKLDQYIGIATTKPAPSGYDILSVAATDWAVFTTIGPFPKAMQDTWARIYAEWMPSSGYQLTGGPELLWHESHNFDDPDFRSEIWIPVIRR